MLAWLTPAERRGAAIVTLLLVLGAVRHWGPEHPAERPRTVAPSGPREVPDRSAAGGWAAPGVGLATPAASGPLDLNRSSAAELEALPGIGPVLAARIVEYRSTYGRFRRLQDLLAVRGVGPRLLARLEPHLRVTQEVAPPASGPGDRAPLGPAVHSAPPPPAVRADSTSVGRVPSR